MISKPTSRFVVAALLCGLTACATLGGRALPDDAARRAAQLANLPDWSFRGRAAVSENGKGWQASLTWLQRTDNYQLDLLGPFGQGRAQIFGSSDSVTLTVDGVTHAADDAGQLLAETTGVELPLVGLRYWVRALEAPHSRGSFDFDKRGLPFRLRQDGWVIEYPNYIDVDGVSLPKRLRASLGDLTLKMVIQDWTLRPI